MRIISSQILAIFVVGAAFNVQAQDLLRSTGSTTHSYNFVEVQYLPDVDASPPVLATALVAINESLSVQAEYLKQTYKGYLQFDNGVTGDADAEAFSVGVLYHQPLRNIANSDWVAGLMIGRINVKLSTAFAAVSDSFNFQEGYLGIRRTLSPRVEGEAGINVHRQSGDTDFTGDLRLVVRVLPQVDVALAINEIGEGDLVGIGLRYTW